LFVGERFDLGFERAYLADTRLQPLELTFVLGTDDLREQLADHAYGEG
jgi:hypothetical protein